MKCRLCGGVQPGKSCDFWNFYEADIARIKAVGGTALRISLEASALSSRPLISVRVVLQPPFCCRFVVL